MKHKVSIYFAGSVQKGHEKAQSEWTNQDLQALQGLLPAYEIHLLNPSTRTDDLSDQKSVFGRDMTQIFICDLLFVDIRHRRGLGVGAEMMWAKFHQKPVLALAPLGIHYRPGKMQILDQMVENFVHPFVENLSDHLVKDLRQGAAWIEKWMKGEVKTVKNLDSIHEAMRYYQETQFSLDDPMQEVIETCSHLDKRMKQILTAPYLT